MVLADAFLEHRAELVPERLVLVLLAHVLAVGQRFEHGQHALGGALADRLHVAAFLQQLARDVQRQVGRVDDALDEAQVHRHQRLGVVHDEDALDVELHAAALVAVPHVQRRVRRDVEQLRVFAAAFHAVVRVGQRRVRIIGNLFVKIGVLGVGDLALGTRPQRGGLVDGLPLVERLVLGGLAVPLFLLHQDRKGDVVGILGDDGLELPRAQELVLAFAQVQDDVGAALGPGDLLHLEIAGAFRAPAHALLRRQAGAARLDGDAVGHDEARVEAHAELADQRGVLLLVAFQPRHELLRAALGDRAQVRHGLLRRQADAVVTDGERLLFRVEEDAQLEVGGVFQELRVVDGLEAQLVAGVRCVRDQFAQEDFLVRVQRVRDEVQDLLDLGLERESLLFHGMKPDLVWVEGGGRGGNGRYGAAPRPRAGLATETAYCRPTANCGPERGFSSADGATSVPMKTGQKPRRVDPPGGRRAADGHPSVERTCFRMHGAFAAGRAPFFMGARLARARPCPAANASGRFHGRVRGHAIRHVVRTTRRPFRRCRTTTGETP